MSSDVIFDEIGDNFGVLDVTTPGSFWLNPPLPMDEDGNLYGTNGVDPGVPRNRTFDVDAPY